MTRSGGGGGMFLVLLAALHALAAGCGGGDDDNGDTGGAAATGGSETGGGTTADLSGQNLEVAAVWTGTEQKAFRKVLDAFEEKTGATVKYTSTGDNISV